MKMKSWNIFPKINERSPEVPNKVVVMRKIVENNKM